MQLVMNGLARAWLLAFTIALVVACGGDGGERGGREIVMPRSALDALDEYAFTSDIDLSSGSGHLEAVFDARFQAPDRFQGTLTASGKQYESLVASSYDLELPLDAEVIAVGSRIWTREAGGDWQEVQESDGFGPFTLLIITGTPQFYLSFKFDSLRLPPAGRVEMVNEVRARPVRLDKAGLIEVLAQGTGCAGAEEPPCTPAAWQYTQQTQMALPEDFVVETWIAEEGSYPVRIVITFSLDEDDGGFFVFTGPQSVRLQMDITDTDIDVEIEPPVETEPPMEE